MRDGGDSMKKRLTSVVCIAGGLLSIGASAETTLPVGCKTAMSYAAQTLDLGIFNSSVSDEGHIPTSITLRRRLKTLEFSNIQDLGNCEDDGATFPEAWC